MIIVRWKARFRVGHNTDRSAQCATGWDSLRCRTGGAVLCWHEHPNEGALNGGVARGRGNLRAQKIGHIKYVDHPFTECRDMRRGDVEIELGERGREVVKEPRPIKAAHFDHGVAVRPLIVDGDLRLEHEGLDASLRGHALGHYLG